MEAVKQWAFAICATMIACGIAQMILPKSNLEKMFRMVVSIFFLCAVLSPLVLRSPELMVDIPAMARTESEARARKVEQIADEQAVELAEKNIGQIVASNLSQRGIKVHAVTINITKDDQNVPQIAEAAILLGEEHSGEHDALTAELEANLGCVIRLSYR